MCTCLDIESNVLKKLNKSDNSSEIHS